MHPKHYQTASDYYGLLAKGEKPILEWLNKSEWNAIDWEPSWAGSQEFRITLPAKEKIEENKRVARNLEIKASGVDPYDCENFDHFYPCNGWRRNYSWAGVNESRYEFRVMAPEFVPYTYADVICGLILQRKGGPPECKAIVVEQRPNGCWAGKSRFVTYQQLFDDYMHQDGSPFGKRA